TGLAPGTFNVTVTDATACTATATGSLIENAALTITLGNDTVVCEGQTVVISAPAGFTTYQWSGSETTQAINPTVNGDYTVTVTNASGCTASDVVSVTFVPMPTVNLGEDKLVYDGENIGINGIVNDGTATGGNYNWMPDTLLNCATCPNVVAFAIDTITYTLIYTDDYGCSGTDNITLNVLPVGDVFWPNAFTPNGDGNNDIFIPSGSGVKQIQWQMFNRWGEKVFESNNFFYGCDGTYQGKPLPMGVYVYTAKIIFMNNKDRKYNGSVTIIR
ncbi:MAG: gliding motility-associated C-terminal domain-containing protein, partial [Chitinophagales bacterium]|nr:gliding motility-associated C-terminal domain-containing protein [Chitinophagales bacterium]